MSVTYLAISRPFTFVDSLVFVFRKKRKWTNYIRSKERSMFAEFILGIPLNLIFYPGLSYGRTGASKDDHFYPSSSCPCLKFQGQPSCLYLKMLRFGLNCSAQSSADTDMNVCRHPCQTLSADKDKDKKNADTYADTRKITLNELFLLSIG